MALVHRLRRMGSRLRELWNVGALGRRGPEARRAGGHADPRPALPPVPPQETLLQPEGADDPAREQRVERPRPTLCEWAARLYYRDVVVASMEHELVTSGCVGGRAQDPEWWDDVFDSAPVCNRKATEHLDGWWLCESCREALVNKKG